MQRHDFRPFGQAPGSSPALAFYRERISFGGMLHKHIYGEEPPRPQLRQIKTPFWRRLPWLVFQTAIVVVVVWVDYERGDPSRPGLALALGIGMALSLTILLTLCWNGLRRLWRALHPVVDDEIPSKRLPPAGGLRIGEVSEQLPRPRIGHYPR